VAISEIYVDPAIAGDSGAGEIAAASLFANLVNATYDHTGNGEGERHLSLTGAFSSYTHTVGDEVYITVATAGIAVPAHYEIASKVDSDAILLTSVAGLTADSGGANVDSDSGPFGDLEYAIEQTTFDTTNGTRVNIKAGTDEVLAAELGTALADTGTSVAWVSSEAAHIVFQGYTSAAGDGGIGQISGGGSVSVIDEIARDYVDLIDLKAHNCGSAVIIELDNWCSAVRCEVTNSTGIGISMDLNALISENYTHNVGGAHIRVTSGIVMINYCEPDGDNPGTMITVDGAFVYRNIVKVASTTDGIQIGQDCECVNNSVWSDGGTGQGFTTKTNSTTQVLLNNIAEGFSGAGGIGFDLDTATFGVNQYRGNAVFDCTTAYTAPGLFARTTSDNETLSASPFRDATNDDFTPLNVGNVLFGALPAAYHSAAPGSNVIRLHKGAVQLPAGGMRIIGQGGPVG